MLPLSVYTAMSKYKLDYASEYNKTPRSFRVPEYLLLGGGPSNSSLRVRTAISMQCLHFMTSDIYKILDEIQAMTKYLFQTRNRLTLAIQTSGNGGNEAVLTNLLDPGDKIVIAIGGVWGETVLGMAQRQKLDILALRKDPGEIYTLEELEKAIVGHKADLLFVTHGETSGGTLQQLENLGAMCHKYNCLLAVDAIVSTGAEPLFVDRWEIDAVTAGSQKAIGAPPGMCLLSFSPRAEERMKKKKEKPSYYLDVQMSAHYWNCYDLDGPRAYHYTYSPNMIYALREALAQICEEGIDNVWIRHEENARLFWEKVQEIGMELFVEKPENRLHGVTCVNIPKDFDEIEFLQYIKNKYFIDITPGEGPTLNKAMRVGLMGENSRPEVVEYLIQAFKDALENSKRKNLPTNL